MSMAMRFWLLLLLIVTAIHAGDLLCVDAATARSEVKALRNLFKSLNSSSELIGWNASGGSPCSQLWRGIHCSKGRVTEINLGGDNLSGELPYSIAAMKSLSYLNVSHNFLSGQVFDFFSKLSKLSTLDLSFNKLSQGIPPSFRSLSKLSVLHLQNNQLSGPLNVICYLPIKDLNIENNNFIGLLPPHLLSDPRFKIGGNNLSHGPGPLPPLCQSPPLYQASSPSQKAIGCLNNITDGLHAKAPAPKHFYPNTKNESYGKKGLSDGAIVGIPLGSIILVLVVALVVTSNVWRSSKNSNESNGNTVSRGSPMSTVQTFEESIVDGESRQPNSVTEGASKK